MDVPTEELFESEPMEEVLTYLVRNETWNSSGTLAGIAYNALERRRPPRRVKLCH